MISVYTISQIFRKQKDIKSANFQMKIESINCVENMKLIER